jgi:5-methylcytosine-specific restriction endonuclease McrA
VQDWKRANRPKHLEAKRRSRDRHVETYRASRRRSRLRSGAEQRLFTAQAIYERDGWLCHLCGEPIDREATDNRYRATLDHLIPVSQGGADVPWNVRAAHQACNSRRRDGGTVQLRLPGEIAA